MDERRYAKDYGNYLEKHRYDGLKNLGTLKPMHIAVLLFITIGGVIMWEMSTKNDGTNIMIVIIIGAFALFIFSKTKTNEGVSYGEAEAIAYKHIKEKMDEEEGGFWKGTLTFHKGYFVPNPNNPCYIFLFYIARISDGLQKHFKCRVMRNDGTFGGYEENKGDISGRPPTNYGESVYNDLTGV